MSSRIIRRPRDELARSDCSVCRAPNSGFHFGAFACAACSAFFRRTIAEKRAYICNRGNRCIIMQGRRTTCRACRLLKCLAQGMNPECVQPHRDSLIPNPGDGSEKRESESRENDFEQVLDEEPNSTQDQLQNSLKNLVGRGPIEVVALDSDFQASETLCYNPDTPVDGRLSSLDLPGPSLPSRNTSVIPTASNVVEHFVANYRRLMERRRMFYCPNSLSDILGGTPAEPRPAIFKTKFAPGKVRFELCNFIELLNSAEAFASLNHETKIAIVRNGAVQFTVFERYFNSVKLGGVELNRIMSPDGAYIDLTNNGAQYEVELLEGVIDHETFLKVFYTPIRESLYSFDSAMKHAEMSEVDFCAVSAVFLFDPYAPNLPLESCRVMEELRDRFYRDWFRHYEEQGLSIDEISLRIGNSLLVLPALKPILARCRENFCIIRFFGILDYDRLIDDLM
ncbi:unnamed protein product [Caenorhabditis auriculariae]|uniref:Nuclear receptor domain-containing protein n=1 Tax=Caenorhabditis auriculariae TaxID=2777116 RepID=A0A8S1HCJ8_9PELO|nr:unnamed protein product [Caenorhabditis auriculariae]